MRVLLLSSFVIVGSIAAGAQTSGTPAKPPQGTTQPKPAPGATTPPVTAPAPATAPAQPRRTPAPAAATSRGGMAITVTDPLGATLPDITVSVSGSTTRSGVTDASGHLNLTGLMAGTYRLRFDGEKVISFEREVTVRGSQVLDVDVTLNPAPEPPPPPQPRPPEPVAVAPAAQVGPKGRPATLDVTELLEKEFVGKNPRRETLLACSGNERTTMIQINEGMPPRVYETADAVYYVLGGDGSVTIDGRTSTIATYGFATVPRGTLHTFDRRGKRALVLLAVLSGEPCEQPK